MKYGQIRYRRYHTRFSAAGTCNVGGHLLAEQLHIVGNDDGAESAGGETLLLLGQAPDQTEKLQNRTRTNTIYLPVTIPFRSLFLFFLILPRQAYYVSSSFPFFAANSFPLTWRSRRFESCLPVWPGPLGHCPKLRHKHEAAGLEIS